ncbi:hypothetical protein BDK51DRAFT_41893 [Blyttiomyces helicus]|uniref:Uncharacterized protein n=1 Tax=Blyttiomyces helicus TaxID=388810 RepID=A0A4P9WJL2_9FUNG|nr:hypothetical protein BDK51DRAFT_41893 [Blyttiomyces helicus]|eukprot:RKO90826.1 hypothetical protein BDK51DRAFT_41893 [Blyttiomyces helicus]
MESDASGAENARGGARTERQIGGAGRQGVCMFTSRAGGEGVRAGGGRGSIMKELLQPRTTAPIPTPTSNPAAPTSKPTGTTTRQVRSQSSVDSFIAARAAAAVAPVSLPTSVAAAVRPISAQPRVAPVIAVPVVVVPQAGSARRSQSVGNLREHYYKANIPRDPSVTLYGTGLDTSSRPQTPSSIDGTTLAATPIASGRSSATPRLSESKSRYQLTSLVTEIHARESNQPPHLFLSRRGRRKSSLERPRSHLQAPLESKWAPALQPVSPLGGNVDRGFSRGFYQAPFYCFSTLNVSSPNPLRRLSIPTNPSPRK